MKNATQTCSFLQIQTAMEKKLSSITLGAKNVKISANRKSINRMYDAGRKGARIMVRTTTNTDTLLNLLKEDSTQYQNLDIDSYTMSEKKNAIRSLMNIRMVREPSAELLKVQDAYLQEELAQKGAVPLSAIPTLRDNTHRRNTDEAHPNALSHNAPDNTVFSDKLSIWQGDITRLQVGAIVNAANSQMLGCFIPCHRCIDNAIHSAAGIQLRTACSQIMGQRRMRYGKQYEEPTGTATLTKAYNLPCEYVIHTVGPIVYGNLNDSLRQDLRNCYRSVLECCLEHDIKSVAFCCISTGEFHFPNEEAAKIAWETVTDFLETYSESLERVIFNVFKDSDREIYEALAR